MGLAVPHLLWSIGSSLPESETVSYQQEEGRGVWWEGGGGGGSWQQLHFLVEKVRFISSTSGEQFQGIPGPRESDFSPD
jgi:hypothetical protein